MLRFLELSWDAIRSTALQLGEWLNGLASGGSVDPRTWPPLVWLVLPLLLLSTVALAWGRRRRAPAGAPEMMISHGEIALVGGPEDDDDVDYGVAAPARASHQLSLTLSNLNPWPVQLLELAVRTRGLRQPVVAEAGSVVPPNGAVDVVADLFDLPGDAGVVELYLYSNRGGRRTYRLSAPLEWEPWDKRYRVKALSSKVTPVAALASQERRRRERRSYESARRRERQKELAEATWRRAEELTQKVRERRAAAAERRVASVPPAPMAHEVRERVVQSGPVDYGAAETVYSGAAAQGAEWASAGAPARDGAHGARPERSREEAEVPRDAHEQHEAREVPGAPPAPPKPRRRLEFPDEF